MAIHSKLINRPAVNQQKIQPVFAKITAFLPAQFHISITPWVNYGQVENVQFPIGVVED